MRRFQDNLYHFGLRTVQILTLLLTGILLLSGLLSTAYSVDMSSQDVLFTWDNPFITVPCSLALCALFWGVTAFVCKNKAKAHRIFRILVLCWCMGISLILILFSKSGPSGDAYSVYSIAENLAVGNTSVIHPTDSYISYYPQQIGLVAFWEVIMRVVNLLPLDLPAYHFIKLFYGFLACIIILFQEKTVHALWKNEKADCLYLCLAGANCPLLMYTSFVYGEIPSFAVLTLGIYFLTELLVGKKARILLSAGSIFFLTLSVMLRKNSLIFVIAVIIVTLLWSLYRERLWLLVFCALCILCTTAALPITESYYEHRSGNEIRSGVTAMSYFAMGMQEAPRAKGWYNGFNFSTYQDSGMNSELANEISREAIAERLAYFGENPGYAASFYLEKYLSQWTDGSYACRQATLATFGGRNDFFTSLYEGENSKYLIAYCNAYQNVLYLGVFVFCLAGLRAKKDPAEEGFSLPAYLGLIAVLGGFLFHMIWEANSRYILLYGLALMPYAAKGLTLLWSTLPVLNAFLRRRCTSAPNPSTPPHK